MPPMETREDEGESDNKMCQCRCSPTKNYGPPSPRTTIIGLSSGM